MNEQEKNDAYATRVADQPETIVSGWSAAFYFTNTR